MLPRTLDLSHAKGSDLSEERTTRPTQGVLPPLVRICDSRLAPVLSDELGA
jgi:hypothetical protein